MNIRNLDIQSGGKYIKICVLAVISLVLFFWLNPFSWNDATERTVVTTATGNQFTEFKPGVFYAGFFAKSQVWPNQISVSYTDTVFNASNGYALTDNTIEIGIVRDVRFNDATTCSVSGITQYILPVSEAQMIAIHNAHKTPEAFVQRRLAPYTVECLKSSAQLMSSEMHYSGGRAQMTQDYMDQLKNGSYLLNVQETNTYDSTEGVRKKIYAVEIQKNIRGERLRKFSSIKEYAVSVGDAQIIDVDYESKVDEMLGKKITAATDASVSKQRLMTAQQQTLTAEAEGKRKLTEIEYVQKQEQTKQVVAAQTLVELAKQDLLKQDIALQASSKEAAKIKILADANAYDKRTAFEANGGLQQKLDAYVEVQKNFAKAMGEYQGNWAPYYQSGPNTGGNAGFNLMEILGAKAAKDLTLDIKTR